MISLIFFRVAIRTQTITQLSANVQKFIHSTFSNLMTFTILVCVCVCVCVCVGGGAINLIYCHNFHEIKDN